VHVINADTGHAVGTQGEIAQTVNGGAIWRRIIASTSRTLQSVWFSDPLTGFICGGHGTVLRTTNGGNSWGELGTGTVKKLYAVHFVNNDTGWVAGAGGVIRTTIDGGNTWQPTPSGYGRTFYSLHFLEPFKGWAVGTNGVVMHYTDSLAFWSSPAGRIPGSSIASIEQNYPNPFNPSTKIRFSLLEATNVTLKVYDVLGREVGTLLVNAPFGAGSHEVLFSSGTLASGVYFARISADGMEYPLFRKMLLLK
jgi:hypothetical protein